MMHERVFAALLAASVLASCALNGENEYSQSSSEYEDAYALLDRLSGGEAKGDFVLACGEDDGRAEIGFCQSRSDNAYHALMPRGGIDHGGVFLLVFRILTNG